MRIQFVGILELAKKVPLWRKNRMMVRKLRALMPAGDGPDIIIKGSDKLLETLKTNLEVQSEVHIVASA